jgi:Cytochrome c7 and related cytochrome c
MRHLLFVFVCVLVCSNENPATAQDGKDTQTALSVSAAHELFGKQCGLCHEPFKGAPEQLCLKCHDGPLHNTAQTVTPPCISCHVEHKGQEKLAQVSNEQCVTCHKDLQVKNSAPLFAKKITGFAQDHSEFAISLKSGSGIKRLRLNETGGNQSDSTTLTFPHDVHLKAGLKSPKGQVQLACKDCHATADDGKQIAPIVYEKHCQSCHQLAFSPDTPNVFAPHAEPSVVHGFLVATFAERRAAAPSPPPAASTPELPTGRLTRPVPSVSPVITAPTSGQSVVAAEKYLYTVTCNKCHVVQNPQARIPTIARVAIPKVWLPHGLFSHRSHRLLECASCHDDVTKSKAATDVNLPSIKVCQQCHRAAVQVAAEPMSQHSATTDCVSCHVYHDKSKDSDWLGTFTVQRILTEGADSKGIGQPKKK